MSIWAKGRTTGRTLLNSLLKLKEEDLEKNVFVIEGRHLYRPLNIRKAGEFNSDDLQDSLILELAVTSFDDFAYKRWANTPDPIIKEGKTICPCCGEEVVRSPEVVLTAIPYYYYYCTKCIYNKEIHQKEPIPEARVDYFEIPEEYKNQE